jgi:hypothetical protein
MRQIINTNNNNICKCVGCYWKISTRGRFKGDKICKHNRLPFVDSFSFINIRHIELYHKKTLTENEKIELISYNNQLPTRSNKIFKFFGIIILYTLIITFVLYYQKHNPNNSKIINTSHVQQVL